MDRCRTLKSSKRISELFATGRSISERYVHLLYLPVDKRRDPKGRVAFICGKRLGNAVVRNTNKRKLRAAADLCELPVESYDLILIATTHTISAKSTEVARSLMYAIQKAGIQ